ncbi:hypothetical protein, partial [Pectobacterium brasiliense]|uniref:hypothetical protein n=1 Tax=Pectobacterium brasiliense TaxID=180957 RepID=UPI00196998AC
IWVALLWGAPTGLLASLAGQKLLGLPPAIVFYAVPALAMLIVASMRSPLPVTPVRKALP